MRRALRRLFPSPLSASVRPTARGWQIIFFGTVAFLLARLIGTTQLYQLAYALAGLLIVALALGLFLSRGIEYTRQAPAGERFVAGRLSHLDLTVHNTSRVRSPSIKVVDYLPGRRLFQIPPVGERERRKLREQALFARRGLYRFGPAEIQTIDPFGLLRFVRRLGERTEVIVYPEVFDLSGFPLRGRGGEAGARGSLARQGDEFSSLREYRHGDDRRHIHWKSVARTGELFVKEFTDAVAPQRYTVVLDLCRAGTGVPETELEDAISVAGSVLLYLAREGLPSRLVCADKEGNATPFGADEASYRRSMDLLAAARADGDTKLKDLLNEKLREGLGEGVILISRSQVDGLLESAGKLRAAGIAVAVVTLATHTYRGSQRTGSEPSTRREAAFSEDVRRLENTGAAVRIVRYPGRVAAFAGGQRRAAADVMGAV